MKLDLYNITGKKVGDVAVAQDVFGAEFNEGLVHQGLVRQRANGRRAIAKTKTRGEVRGGGRKPHAQKGTGRARSGSIRNPVWRGGGVTFGPTGTENYTKQMPKKQRKQAICSVISEKVREKQVIVLDKYTETEVKTRLFADMIAKLPVERSVLFVTAGNDDVVKKSAKNISNVRIITAQFLNIADVLKYRYVVFTEEAIRKTEETFSIQSSK